MVPRSSSHFTSLAALLLVAFVLTGCGGESGDSRGPDGPGASDDPSTSNTPGTSDTPGAADAPAATVSSLSYKGHENDFDSNALAQAYPAIHGTRVDDCQTCHTGGMVAGADGKTSTINPCSYCHLIPFPDPSLVTGVPEDYAATLNPFGLDYSEAGRSLEALRGIKNRDSDGDSHTNAEELNDLRYPGDPASKPGQPILPVRTFSREDLEELPRHEQFLLMNSHKQQYDSYATYRGVRLEDLLAASGADLTSATSITCIAPDGFAMDFPVEAIHSPYPQSTYHARLGIDDFDDPNQGVAHYPPPSAMPPDLAGGEEIPDECRLMDAFARDGAPMDPSHLDPATGKLEGEGPYRLIAPQSRPGAPDRGSDYSPSGYDDGYDYDDAKDHNAGLCVRGLVAVRVNPIPPGYEEFDWKNGGWSLVEREEIIVYGAGLTEASQQGE